MNLNPERAEAWSSLSDRTLLIHHILEFSGGEVVVGPEVFSVRLQARSAAAFVQHPFKLSAAQSCHDTKDDDDEADEYNDTDF